MADEQVPRCTVCGALGVKPIGSRKWTHNWTQDYAVSKHAHEFMPDEAFILADQRRSDARYRDRMWFESRHRDELRYLRDIEAR